MVDGDDGASHGKLLRRPDAIAVLDVADELFELVETFGRFLVDESFMRR